MREQLERWREELINLGRNNRLLFYKPTKASTLELLAPDPGTVLRRLSEDNAGAWRFFMPPEPSEDDPAIRRAKDWIHLRDSNELVTQKTERSAVESALRLLNRRATQEFVDRGLSVLYLAAGFLEWIDPDTDERGLAPLLLVPVELRRENPRMPFELHRAEEDVRINQALTVRMQRLGITLPDFDEDVLEDGAVDEVLVGVERVVRRHPGWGVTDQVVIGVFSFHKEVMYRDLLEHEEIVAAHPAVRGLAIGPDADVNLDFDPVPEAHLDELVPPEGMVTILDTDATQRQCIAAARDGRSFVMDGPPGTGKSQTIANVITELITAGKSVLFVSEKAAALEVVQSRLAEAGLGEFLLELHSHKATRREVATELGRALQTHPVAGRDMTPARREQVLQARVELTAHADAMHERREPLGESLFAAIGEVSALHQFPRAPAAKALASSLEPGVLTRLTDVAAALGRSWGPVTRGDDFLWRGLTVVDGNDEYELRRALETAAATLGELEAESRRISEETLLTPPEAAPHVEGLVEVLDLLSTRPDGVPPRWLAGVDPREVRERLWDLRDEADRHSQAAAVAQDRVGGSWRQLEPMDDLASAAAHVRESRFGWELPPDLGGSQLADLSSFVRASVEALGEFTTATTELGVPLGVGADEVSLSRAEEIAELAAMAADQHPPEAAWLSPEGLLRAQEGSRRIAELVEDVRTKHRVVEATYADAALDLDLRGLLERFTNQHRGLRRLTRAYRDDRRTLRAATATGKLDRATRDLLVDALAWQEAHRLLESVAAQHRDVSDSPCYEASNTNLDALQEVVAVAGRMVELAGAGANPLALADALARTGSRDQRKVVDARGLIFRITQWQQHAEEALPSGASVFDGVPISDIVEWCTRVLPDLDLLHQRVAVADRLAGNPVSLADAEEAYRARTEVDWVEMRIATGRQQDGDLIGDRYQQLDSDWGALLEASTWAINVTEAVDEGLDDRQAEILTVFAPDPECLRTVVASWNKARDALLDHFDPDRVDELRADLEVPFADGVLLLQDLLGTIEDAEEWFAYRRALDELREAGLADVVETCIGSRIDPDEVMPVVRRSMLQGWVDHQMRQDPRLSTTRALDQDELVATFRDLDRQLVSTASARAIHACTERRPTTTAGQPGVILREANKRSRHMPVRDLLGKARDVVLDLKPCLMMSPLTVSQFLPSNLRFDCVIFDEASQVKPADAINCIYRGAQLIVAGDQRQLPPTAFFEHLDDDGDDYVEEQLESFESVLDLCKAAGWMRGLPLRWHYRSQHEGLITFSNYEFYDGGLVTFPSSQQEGPDLGIQLYRVPGVYRRGGARDNQIEAEAVLERVLFHAEHHPDLTLGVVTFSEAQASCIEYQIERERQLRPDLDGYFHADRLHGFFVKALEAVQGDERDIIIFSVGYGPDEIGRFTQNFGPLNRDGGWRRLNVAVTRARRRVEIVASIGAVDFGRFESIRSQGVNELRRYLDYAERGIDAVAPDMEDSEGDAESPFEEEVLRVINSWGYEAVPQVGHAGFRVDIGVRQPGRQGTFALGVECDGAMYHSSRVARDRDRLRQEVLERLGWKIHRIWGTAWYRERGREETRLRAAIEAAIAGEGHSRVPVPAASRPVVALEEIELGQAPPWAQPYEVAVVSTSPYFRTMGMQDPRALPEIQDLLARVVAVESPVHAEVALARVREAWRTGRAGARMRTSFETAVRMLSRTGLIHQADGFFLSPQVEDVHVRVPVVRMPQTFRTVTQVHPTELDAAVLAMVRDARSIHDDELTRTVAAIFGWQRRGTAISTQLASSIRRLLRSGELTRVDGDLTVGNQAS